MMNAKLSLFSLLLAALLLGGCGTQLGWPDSRPETSDDDSDSDSASLRIFVSHDTTDGAISTGGVGLADSLCDGDDNRPTTGTYKALIVDGDSRIGLPGSQRSWALAASRKYTRTDGTVIGTTTSTGVFSFPLTAAIGTSSVQVWTGIASSSWTTGSHCTKWTDGTAGASGSYGLDNLTDSGSIASGTVTCDKEYHVYCVEQPSFDDDDD